MTRAWPAKRVAAGVTLVALIVTAMGTGLAIARVGEAALPATRSSYRRYLERRGAALLPARGGELQAGFSDCGLAVAREAARALGVGREARDSMALVLSPNPRGVTLTELAKTLERFGVPGARVEPTEPAERGRRAVPRGLYVAHLSIGHFVLVRDTDERRVFFFDPLIGEVAMPLNAFEALWSGAGIRVGPDTLTLSMGVPAHRRGAVAVVSTHLDRSGP